jgi:predicted nucleic acid-binding protein
MILLDANILLRMSNHRDPDCKRTLRVVYEHKKSTEVVIVPQTLYEFWAVATRSKQYNGLGMDIARVRMWIAASQHYYRLLPEPEKILPTWAALVEMHQVKGFRAHDARYVAMMQLHGITHLMTYNVSHFQDYGISILDPSTL